MCEYIIFSEWYVVRGTLFNLMLGDAVKGEPPSQVSVLVCDTIRTVPIRVVLQQRTADNTTVYASPRIA